LVGLGFVIASLVVAATVVIGLVKAFLFLLEGVVE
jgi:hypothetical protein